MITLNKSIFSNTANANLAASIALQNGGIAKIKGRKGYLCVTVKRLFVIATLLFAGFFGKAQQIQTSFTFCAIGGSNGALLFSAGSPLVVDAKGKCLSATNGLITMSVNDSALGKFSPSCEEKAPFEAKISIVPSVYPNPTNGISWIRTEGYVDGSIQCQLKIVSLSGNVVIDRTVHMSDFQSGYMINLSSYAAGTYIVNMQLPGQNYSLKLIKVSSL